MAKAKTKTKAKARATKTKPQREQWQPCTYYRVFERFDMAGNRSYEIQGFKAERTSYGVVRLLDGEGAGPFQPERFMSEDELSESQEEALDRHQRKLAVRVENARDACDRAILDHQRFLNKCFQRTNLTVTP